MLRIEQDSEYQGAGYWKWSVWIDATDAELDKIESVEYALHPTFANPIRVVDDRETKFRLETAGWGEFLLYATAMLSDGRTVELEHELKLSRPDWPEPVEKEFAVPPPEPEPPVPAEDGAAQADAFFEGPMFGGIAFAGALEGARAAGGITRWGRVGGASGGALVAALLVVGYDVDEIRALLMSVNLSGLARWRLGWARVLAVLRLFYGRGLFSPDRIEAWLEEVLTAKVGHSPTFADVTDPRMRARRGRPNTGCDCLPPI